jgi:hypothetical protein
MLRHPLAHRFSQPFLGRGTSDLALILGILLYSCLYTSVIARSKPCLSLRSYAQSTTELRPVDFYFADSLRAQLIEVRRYLPAGSLLYGFHQVGVALRPGPKPLFFLPH